MHLYVINIVHIKKSHIELKIKLVIPKTKEKNITLKIRIIPIFTCCIRDLKIKHPRSIQDERINAQRSHLKSIVILVI